MLYLYAASGNLYTRLYIANGNYTTSVSGITQSTWTRIVATHDLATSTTKIYYNGVINKIDTGKSGFLDTSTTATIGNYHTDGINQLVGKIAKPMFWKNKVLSQTEVNQDYAGVRITDGLTYEADFDEQGGLVCFDYTNHELLTPNVEKELRENYPQLYYQIYENNDSTFTLSDFELQYK